MLVMAFVLAGLAGLAAIFNSPPIAVKPDGLRALEAAENRDFQDLMDTINTRGEPITYTPEPRDPNAPIPAETRLYNNLLDNLLSGLHYYYKAPEDSPPSQFVTSWNAGDGGRNISDARLLSLEINLSYLLTLERYRRLHSKAIFDDDLEYARKRVGDIFNEDWHSMAEWPLGLYFDLIDLYELTGEEKYLEWSERYAIGDGPNDSDTPLAMAKNLAFRYQFDQPRMASPFYFYYAAFLADWGNRHDPTLANQAHYMFTGLRDLLYDPRYKMLWKQASVSQGGSGSKNIIETFNTLEQLTAIQAILEYGKASGDTEALSLARVILSGVWGTSSPLLRTAPEPYAENTFFGLYTAYDHGREAERYDPGMTTIDHILLFNSIVLLNAATKGEMRGDIDFLVNWLETVGPVYKPNANGYYVLYDENWESPDPNEQWVSAKASIWMARAIIEDEWYKYLRTEELTSQGRY